MPQYVTIFVSEKLTGLCSLKPHDSDLLDYPPKVGKPATYRETVSVHRRLYPNRRRLAIAGPR